MSTTLVSIINNQERLYPGELKSYFKLVFRAPNASHPYHNFRHTMHVLCQVYEAAKYGHYSETAGPAKFRALLIAALFHDYGHSRESGPDALEIAHALKALNENILDIDRELLPEIITLIQATEYPHHGVPLSPGATLLREADLSQLFSPVWLQQIVFGLAAERGLSPEICLAEEISFLETLKFESAWGRETLAPQIPEKLREVRELLDLLE